MKNLQSKVKTAIEDYSKSGKYPDKVITPGDVQLLIDSELAGQKGLCSGQSDLLPSYLGYVLTDYRGIEIHGVEFLPDKTAKEIEEKRKNSPNLLVLCRRLGFWESLFSKEDKNFGEIAYY